MIKFSSDIVTVEKNILKYSFDTVKVEEHTYSSDTVTVEKHH